MSILGELLGSRIRREMKSRVDEILRAGNEWCKTANILTAELKRLADVIEGGSTGSDLKALARTSRQLSKSTKRLARAFENHRKTLQKVASHL